MVIIQQSLKSENLRLTTGNLANTLSVLQAVEKRSLDTENQDGGLQGTGLVPCFPRFDSGKFVRDILYPKECRM